MRIIMVCLGNICRSPLADGLMRKKIADQKLDAEVDSAGTGDWHIGEAPDPRMIETAKNRGLDISMLRGRQFQVEDYDEFDKIYVMDQSNYQNVVKLAQTHDHKKKVELILNEITPGSDAEVPDPYFGGDDGFKHVFELLDNATDQIIKKHLQG